MSKSTVEEVIEKIIETVWDETSEGWNGEYMGQSNQPFIDRVDSDGDLRKEVATQITLLIDSAIERIEEKKYPEIKHDDNSSTFPDVDPSDPDKTPLYMRFARNQALTQAIQILNEMKGVE